MIDLPKLDLPPEARARILRRGLATLNRGRWFDRVLLPAAAAAVALLQLSSALRAIF
jgi:hypothetical protein